MIEARCQRCDEVFVPHDENDLVHLETEMGDPCFGPGVITGMSGEALLRHILAQPTSSGVSPCCGVPTSINLDDDLEYCMVCFKAVNE